MKICFLYTTLSTTVVGSPEPAPTLLICCQECHSVTGTLFKIN